MSFAWRMDTTWLMKLHKPCSLFCDQPWGLPNLIFNIGGSSWGTEMTQWWEPSPPISLTQAWVCCCFLPCSEGFPLGSPPFPPPTKKTASPNSNSTRIEGLNGNLLFLSKYFNSNLYFSFCNKDRHVSCGQKKIQTPLVSRWTLKRRIVEYGLLDDFGWATRQSRRTFRFMMGDQSTERKRESIGHVDLGDWVSGKPE